MAEQLDTPIQKEPEAVSIPRTRRPILRIVATLTAWLIVIVYIHHYVHVFEADIGRRLNSPLLQITAAIIGLTGLLYFIILSLPIARIPRWRGVLILLLWTALVVLGHGLTHLGVDNAQSLLKDLQSAIGPLGMLLLVAAYAIALAIPFVAGVEIGFLIMAVFGVKGVIIAYAGTLVGLSIAFAAGQLLSPKMLDFVLRRLGVSINSQTFEDALGVAMKGNAAGRGIRHKIATLLLRHRYLTLAILLNCPANALIGGGGGLALFSGMSREIRWSRFLPTIALAVAPVPILVLFGLMNVEPILHHYGVIHDLLTALKQHLP